MEAPIESATVRHVQWLSPFARVRNDSQRAWSAGGAYAQFVTPTGSQRRSLYRDRLGTDPSATGRRPDSDHRVSSEAEAAHRETGRGGKRGHVARGVRGSTCGSSAQLCSGGQAQETASSWTRAICALLSARSKTATSSTQPLKRLACGAE
jgi:hypothetical protein